MLSIVVFLIDLNANACDKMCENLKLKKTIFHPIQKRIEASKVQQKSEEKTKTVQ